MNKTQKFGLLTSLYIAQGLPFGFFMQSLPVLLRHEGLSLETIGFSAVLVLPWAFKFAWAPVVDQWASHRRWILWMNILAVICLITLSFFPLATLLQHGPYLLFGSFFVMNLFSATQDIATDSLAVNQLTHEERGLGNGIQVAGYRIGMIIGGGLLLAWFAQLGWQWSMILLALLLMATTLPVLRFQEPVRGNTETLVLSDFVQFFRQHNIGLWLVILLLYKFSDHFAGTMVRPLLIDYQFSMTDIALILGTVGFGAGLFGALAGGVLTTFLGRYHALFLFAIIQALSVASWALIPLGFNAIGLVYFLSAFEHFAGGLATAALFTVMMDHCRLNCAGSDFTIQACIVVLVGMASAALSGISASSLGYANHFILSGVAGVVCLPLLIAYKHSLFTASNLSKEVQYS